MKLDDRIKEMAKINEAQGCWPNIVAALLQIRGSVR
jgi:hypothetical protein